jgi:type VI secretion system protein ImpA
MPLRDDLLTPIAGGNPAGTDLRYDPIFDRIKEARREDDDAPQGDWQRERKVADFGQVTKLAGDVLATKSKDLQVAAWLTEAQLRREGLPGLRAGLVVLRGMLDDFWEHLYPEIEDGDLELRAAPLEWVGTRLELPVTRIAITTSGLDQLAYAASGNVPTESDAALDPLKAEAREQAIIEGRATPEEFEQAFVSTPKAWYKSLRSDIDGCLEALQSLDESAQARFGGDAAPSFARLRNALEQVRHVARQLLAKKLEIDPDPRDATAAGDIDVTPVATGGGASPADRGASRSLPADPVDRDDAAGRIAGAARFLRRTDPANPAPYLLLRGFRWGELRASGTSPDPKLFDAPPTHVRTQLKSLLLDRKWAELLEAAETVMGTPQGRGWLDLQRYALTACDGLGFEFAPVGEAIRGALRALLADLPGLTEMTLMDDTPTANAETLAWLRATVVAGVEGAPATAENGRQTERVVYDDGARGREAYERALSELRAGRADTAIELLMRQLDREKTRRGRFMRQAQLAELMVGAGLESVAKPILEELMVQIETHKLDEWESGELIAQPMALLFRCLERIDGDPVFKQALYLRICRLDPRQAIGFAAPA